MSCRTGKYPEVGATIYSRRRELGRQLREARYPRYYGTPFSALLGALILARYTNAAGWTREGAISGGGANH